MIAILFPEIELNFNLCNKELTLFNKSIIDTQVAWLTKESNLIDTIIVVSSLPEINYKNGEIRYIYVQAAEQQYDMQLVKSFLKEEPFFVVLGNVFSGTKPDDLLKKMKQKGSSGVFSYSSNADQPTGYFFQLDKKKVLQDIEYANSEYTNFSNNIFCLDSELLTYLGDNQTHLFYEFIAAMIKKEKSFFGVENKGLFFNILDPQSLYAASYHILNSGFVEIEGNKINQSFYGDKCEIEFSSKVKGINFFGHDLTVLPQCVLEKNIIGNNVKIGKNCIVKNSIMYNNCQIGDNCEIIDAIIGEDSIIENNVHLPMGTVLARKSILTKGTGTLNV